MEKDLQIKKCLYETLEIERDASADEIKLKYRKLALKWHPDKNVGNQEEATEVFKQIQNAYTVLSDPRERRWYDEHREQILRGGDEADGDHDFVPNIFPFFDTSCYSGYGDDGKGFYTVYAAVFEEINDKERTAFDAANPRGLFEARPPLGGAGAAWAVVEAFYSAWQSFNTNLSFSWEDKWDETDAPDRRVRRAMEKENKSARSQKRKEYQDQVRALVDFCKRRDKRVVLRQKEMRQAKEEKARKLEEEKKRKKALHKEQREQYLQEQQAMYEALEREREKNGYGAALRLADEDSDASSSEEGGAEDEDGAGGGGGGERGAEEALEEEQGEEEEGELPPPPPPSGGGGGGGKKNKGKKKKGKGAAAAATVYWCPACRKSFKSEKQSENHARSKAHKKKMEKYVPEPEEEEEEASGSERGSSGGESSGDPGHQIGQQEEQTSAHHDSENEVFSDFVDVDAALREIHDELEREKELLSSEQKKHSKEAATTTRRGPCSEESSHARSATEESDSDEDEYFLRSIGKVQVSSEGFNQSQESDDEGQYDRTMGNNPRNKSEGYKSDEDSPENSTDEPNFRDLSSKEENTEFKESTNLPEPPCATSQTNSSQENDQGGGDATINVEELIQPPPNPPLAENVSDQEEEPEMGKKKKKGRRAKPKKDTKKVQQASAKQDGDFLCRGCTLTFTSKNKLFSHLKESGHTQQQRR